MMMGKNKKRCSICADWDGSRAACQKRTAALRATIPGDVLKKVEEWKVSSFGISPAKFVGWTEDFRPPKPFNAILDHFANGSCVGIRYGFIAFRRGGRLVFSGNAYERFEAAGGTS
jgi:hypothetical protein